MRLDEWKWMKNERAFVCFDKFTFVFIACFYVIMLKLIYYLFCLLFIRVDFFKK